VDATTRSEDDNEEDHSCGGLQLILEQQLSSAARRRSHGGRATQDGSEQAGSTAAEPDNRQAARHCHVYEIIYHRNVDILRQTERRPVPGRTHGGSVNASDNECK